MTRKTKLTMAELMCELHAIAHGCVSEDGFTVLMGEIGQPFEYECRKCGKGGTAKWWLEEAAAGDLSKDAALLALKALPHVRKQLEELE